MRAFGADLSEFGTNHPVFSLVVPVFLFSIPILFIVVKRRKQTLRGILAQWAADHPMKLPPIIFFLYTALLAAITDLFNYYDDGEIFKDIAVEAHGMALDLLIIGWFLLWITNLGERRVTIKRYREEIDDFRGWQSTEAAYRIRGIIRRLNEAGVTKITLDRVFLVGTNLEKLNLEGASLESAHLEGTQLNWSNLRKANLTNAKLENAFLMWADLRGAYLEVAKLRGAMLNGANLSEAFLFGTDLTGADLAKADLRGAYLKPDGDWRQIQSLKLANIYGVKNAPEGFVEWALNEMNAVSIESDETWRKLLRNSGGVWLPPGLEG